MSDFIQILKRRDTAAAWTAANPVLAAGEDGYELDTGKCKTGDGTTAWRALAYNSGSGGAASFADITGEVGTNAKLATALGNKINTSEKGAANGVAPLGATLKIDELYIPEDVERTNKKGVAGGYAPLGSDIKVPDANLPLNIERTSKKGVAGGYAGLDASGKVANSVLPADVQLKTEKGNPLGYAPLNEEGKVPANHLPVISGGGGGGGENIPHGVIVMWSGTLLNIPDGWALCDGYNGTPNLLDRFIVSVPSANTNPGGTGGENEKRLTIENMPNHGHSFTGSSHTHRIPAHSHHVRLRTDSATDSHSHYVSVSAANGNWILGSSPGSSWYFAKTNADTGTKIGHGFDSQSELRRMSYLSGSTESSSSSHYHMAEGMTTPTSETSTDSSAISGSVGNSGGGASFSIVPKYYALAFIMKL